MDDEVKGMTSDELAKGGFRLWLDPYGASKGNPLSHQLVETYNAYSGKRSIFDPHAMHPAQNVANLWWRPFGDRGSKLVG